MVDIVPLSSTGTAVFLAAVLSGLLLGVWPASLARILGRTVRRMVPAIAAIFCMLALGFVTKYSGMDAVLGLAFTRTGPMLYPIFGTLLGWLGRRPDRLGHLEQRPLRQPPEDHRDASSGSSPILMASANTTGGVMGKMIDAQSIVVAAAATGEGGKEGDIAPRRPLAQRRPGPDRRGDRLGLRPRLPRLVVAPAGGGDAPGRDAADRRLESARRAVRCEAPPLGRHVQAGSAAGRAQDAEHSARKNGAVGPCGLRGYLARPLSSCSAHA